MTLKLINHDRRFAVEQAIFNYFPRKWGGKVIAKLSGNKNLATVRIAHNHKIASGRAWVKGSVDNALRLAFYRAAKKLLPAPPPWGSLTGIRPAKLAVELYDLGFDIAQELAKRYEVTPERAELAADCAKNSINLREKLTNRDIALYISIPFCPTRCAYCSFVSISVERDFALLEKYCEALKMEIAALGEKTAKQDLTIRSIYWGGGTPAVLPPEQFSDLAGAISRHFDLSKLWEYTVEAGRPDVVTPQKLEAYIKAGATRISINPQTLQQEILDYIGRKHTAEEFRKAYKLAKSAGFRQVNVDLIAGLPGDTAEGYIDGLSEIIGLEPENITIHTLALKRASLLNLQGCEVCGAETTEEMLSASNKQLRNSGYLPYYLYRQKFSNGENTGWAKPGHECAYNLMMMEELSSVLSLGAGGVTKIIEGNVITRGFHPKEPLGYINKGGFLWE